jgi:surface polysaccharide O-acyltransferase-like enzyme
MTRVAHKRLDWLDFWRIVSAIAIIWLHTPESEALSRSTGFTRYAVPFFVASAAFMACRIQVGTFKQSFQSFVWSRWLRIYVPFLGWSAIYLIARYLASFVLPHTSPYPITWELLWRGPTSHLWFLPFIFVATIFANLIGRRVSAKPSMAWPFVAILLALSACILLKPTFSDDFQYTAHLSYDTLPALFWGISLAIFCSRVGTEWLAQKATIVVAYIAFLIMEIILSLQGRQMLAENLAGTLLLLTCFTECHNGWVLAIAAFGTLAYGVYLSHMLFVEGFQDIAQYAGFSEGALNDLIVFALSAVCAILLTICLKKSRYFSWLAP